MSETRRLSTTALLDSLYDLALNRFIEESDFDPRDHLTDEESAVWDTAQQEELDTPFNGPRYVGKVVVEILGGVAEVTSKPDNIEVHIIDHDNEQ